MEYRNLIESTNVPVLKIAVMHLNNISFHQLYFFSFLNQIYVVGTQKHNNNEQPKHTCMFKLIMDKKIITVFHARKCFALDLWYVFFL